MAGVSLQGTAQIKPGKEIPKIIFDTDMGPDYDDVGAIAVLHALADSGECEILATVASAGHATIAPTIELFNRYFGRPELPIGIPADDAPDYTAKNNWNELILKQYAPDLINRTYPGAVNVYRKVLAAQPDNSVVIVTVGFLSNISDLLASPPDAYSALTGMELVKAKVKQWVAMAGNLPEGKEFNVVEDAQAAYDAVSQWPKPLLISGFEIGSKIFTGGALNEKGDKAGPVAAAYAYNLKTYEDEAKTSRPSWDQTTVLAAVRNPEDYFYVNGPGQFVVDNNGFNTWNPLANKEHYFLTHKYPYAHIEAVIETLMLHVPEK
ncbi:Inosine-uridine nucleoside N-ribohydrolase [Parapedobacter koreensis]|uniref:Inosine-uridine nucleoside N-ribohydrolase n=2 Tax=Parapedobacter koreensis TaxID=332977 RepID=A0A1H7EVU9_9SPHI|nr:Inosine-uridine nucleoside N-ribohydrolase [Parapedobacter koreensis]